MATATATWTENQALTFDDATPAKTVEGKAQLDLDAVGAIMANVQLSITFGASADGNAEVRVRSSPDSGTTKDTEYWYNFEVTYTASTTKIVSFPVRDTPYVEIGIYNGNAAVEDITISGKYAYLTYDIS